MKFIIRFNGNYFNKNDILTLQKGYDVKIIKVYKYNWYRKVLHFFGFKFKLYNCVKVETIK